MFLQRLLIDTYGVFGPLRKIKANFTCNNYFDNRQPFEKLILVNKSLINFFCVIVKKVMPFWHIMFFHYNSLFFLNHM